MSNDIKTKEFDVGDTIHISCYGGCYTTYQGMADKFKLKNYTYQHSAGICKNKNGVILGGAFDADSNSYIYGIKLETGEDVLMTNSLVMYDEVTRALTLVRKRIVNTFDEDLFTL
jgi:hypothetical protein